MSKLAAAFSVLAIGGAMEGCGDAEPNVDKGVQLADQDSNRKLACAREMFQAVGFHNPLALNRWAGQNCPGFANDVERLRAMEHPLAEIAETRKEILANAGVDPSIERWIVRVAKDPDEMVVIVDPDAVEAAKKLGKVK